MSHKHVNQSGFTIVELLMSIGIATVIATVLLSISLTFFGSTARSQVTAQMAVDSHFMLRAIIEDLRLADSIGVSNNLPDANAPGTGWITSDASNVLVINSPATTVNNEIIYDPNTGNPYNNEYIYFVSGSTLYKRLLQNSLATGNSIRTTCPDSLASSTCPADRKYSTDVDDMTFTFYDASNNVVSDPTVARSVRVGLLMSRRVFGSNVTFNNSILTKLRN